jgi:hypothetical protein
MVLFQRFACPAAALVLSMGSLFATVGCGAGVGVDAENEATDPSNAAAICTPRSCASVGTAGAVDDGCGGTLVCECQTEFRGELATTKCVAATRGAQVSSVVEAPAAGDAGTSGTGGSSGAGSTSTPTPNVQPDAGAGSADAAAEADRCAPRNMRELAGYTFTLTVTPSGGVLEMKGDDVSNVILVTGTGVAQEVSLGDGRNVPDVIVPCVTEIHVKGHAGDDQITLGGPKKFVGISRIRVEGGQGEDVCTVNAGGLGSASDVGYNEEG